MTDELILFLRGEAQKYRQTAVLATEEKIRQDRIIQAERCERAADFIEAHLDTPESANLSNAVRTR